MSNVAKLKKRAGEFEQKKQFDKALAIYLQIVEEIDGSADEADVALFNRVGDLLLRQGNVGEAVDYYERAVDLYAEGGFFNNAIALCNKILRNAPGRNSIYYKLGKISAKKGFTNDAKQNFLEYADRMQKSGKLDEAFRALKEFADLCPDQDDIRLMLADQLVKKNRKSEAIQQLQLLYEKFHHEGRAGEARATVDRMKAIDPSVEPTSREKPATPKSTDLVFLDVGLDDAPPRGRTSRPGAAKAPPAPPPGRARAVPPELEPPPARSEVDLGLVDTDPSVGAAPEPLPAMEGGPADPGLLPGFEQTTMGNDFGGFGNVPLLDIEPTSIGGSAPQPPDDYTLPGELPMLDVPDDSPAGPPLEFIMPDDSGDPAGLGTLSGLGSEVEPEESVMIPDVDRAAGGAAWEIRLEDSAFLSTDRGAPGSPNGALAESDLPFIDVGGAHVADAAPLSADELQTPPDSSLAQIVDQLRDKVADDPGNWHLHKQLGEAMLEDGDREGGIDELEMAMVGFESASDYASARQVADEILHLDPNSVRHHQKRVEYSFLLHDRARLVDAYLQLADCLFRSGDQDKAQTVYERVIEIAPDDARARAALGVYGEAGGSGSSMTLGAAPARAPIESASTGSSRPAAGLFDALRSDALERSLRGGPGHTRPASPTPAQPAKAASAPATVPKPAAPKPAPPAPAPKSAPAKPTAPAAAKPPAAPPSAAPGGAAASQRDRKREPAKPASRSSGSDSDFVNLADWLAEEDSPKTTRMKAGVPEPEKQQVDFSEMLAMFKQGVAQNVAEEDYEAHYDLGVAYKEMGLLDEAIAEFQKALRGSEHRIRTYEALGQCFIERRQFQVAATSLARALADERATDERLIGVLYLLGYASEALRRWTDAQMYYERVLAVDIQFRDVTQRLAAIEKVAR